MSWKKKLNTRESFQYIYTLVIFIDSIYQKDENYYPKVFLEKYFIEDIEILILILIFSNSDIEHYEERINLFLETLKSSLLKYKKFFKLGA